MLEASHRLKAVPVRTGATDGTSTAVYSDSLHEGDAVVLSMEGGGAAAAQVVNPFAPRFGGGGGGRR